MFFLCLSTRMTIHQRNALLFQHFSVPPLVRRYFILFLFIILSEILFFFFFVSVATISHQQQQQLQLHPDHNKKSYNYRKAIIIKSLPYMENGNCDITRICLTQLYWWVEKISKGRKSEMIELYTFVLMR